MEKAKRPETVGTVVLEGGKYFLEVAGKREELPAGLVAEEAQLKELVGQKVEVLYSEPTRFVIGLAARQRPPIVVCYFPPLPWPPCYIPIPFWVMRGIEKEVRVNLAKGLLEEKIISKEVYEKLL
jgi:hypothetical protein